jgi:hypothetical protein
MVMSKPLAFKASGGTKYGDSRCVIALNDIFTFTMNPGTDLNVAIAGSSVLSTPMFRRYANLYGKFRVKSMKVQWYTDTHCTHLLSAVTQMSETAPVDQAAYLRDITCRFHDLSRRDISQSRTLIAPDIPLFNTFQSTGEVAGNLPDCAINFLLKHFETPRSNVNVECRVTFVTEFGFMNKSVPEIDLQAP